MQTDKGLNLGINPYTFTNIANAYQCFSSGKAYCSPNAQGVVVAYNSGTKECETKCFVSVQTVSKPGYTYMSCPLP